MDFIKYLLKTTEVVAHKNFSWFYKWMIIMMMMMMMMSVSLYVLVFTVNRMCCHFMCSVVS